ncbi:hypothetical protein B0H14DRAFT_2596669 [Mycena olivaceomarginata]|nr:hypothetical protein B0H14DRAFT_2596669 [Mycena olivaceomarginata]
MVGAKWLFLIYFGYRAVGYHSPEKFPFASIFAGELVLSIAQAGLEALNTDADHEKVTIADASPTLEGSVVGQTCRALMPFTASRDEPYYADACYLQYLSRYLSEAFDTPDLVVPETVDTPTTGAITSHSRLVYNESELLRDQSSEGVGGREAADQPLVIYNKNGISTIEPAIQSPQLGMGAELNIMIDFCMPLDGANLSTTEPAIQSPQLGM